MTPWATPAFQVSPYRARRGGVGSQHGQAAEQSACMMIALTEWPGANSRNGRTIAPGGGGHAKRRNGPAIQCAIGAAMLGMRRGRS